MKVPLSANANLLLDNPEALKKIMTAMSSRHIGDIDNPFIITIDINTRKTKKRITLKI